MASQKHLRDLLQEDQEPFRLKSYISERQFQIKRPSTSGSHLQVKKQKPISQNSSFSSNFRRNACFFSLRESPDPRKSPLFEIQSPNKSPNGIFLNIPARTAALLLEAALKIQKQSTDNLKAKKAQNRGNGFGLFGSMLKKLTHRKKHQIGGDGVKVSVRDILRWDSPVVRKRFNTNVKSEQVSKQGKLEEKEREKSCFETRSSWRSSSCLWSESNEEKSLDCDLENSSSSGLLNGSEEMDVFACEIMDGVDFADYDKRFCESPFRFALRTSPSPGRRTPNFSSPAPSPSRRRTENKEAYERESLKKLQVEEEEDEEEEDKEQCSPVSVLDPPFEDDDDDDDNDDDAHITDEDESFDISSSYAIVQRAKHQLLQKLRRFEKLADLEPVELERRMSEQDQDDEETDDNTYEEEECEFDEESDLVHKQETKMNGLVQQILESTLDNFKRIPEGMKRLIMDLVAEEERGASFLMNTEIVAKRVCERLDSWREVESNTIDMMVEQDFRQEVDVWKKNQEQFQEAALEIEQAIFGYLTEELSEELDLF